MLEMLANGVANILTPGVLACLLGGVTVGLILGAIPGLSATMAIALVIPFTFCSSSLKKIAVSSPSTPSTWFKSAGSLDGIYRFATSHATAAVMSNNKTAVIQTGCLFSFKVPPPESYLSFKYIIFSMGYILIFF